MEQHQRREYYDLATANVASAKVINVCNKNMLAGEEMLNAHLMSHVINLLRID
jgi:hypothetical protein